MTRPSRRAEPVPALRAGGWPLTVLALITGHAAGRAVVDFAGVAEAAVGRLKVGQVVHARQQFAVEPARPPPDRNYVIDGHRAVVAADPANPRPGQNDRPVLLEPPVTRPAGAGGHSPGADPPPR